MEEEEEEGSRRRRIGSDDELDDRPAKKRGRRRDKDDGDDTGMADEDGEEDELEEPDEDDLGFIVDEEGNEVAYGGPKWGAGGNRGRVSTKEIGSSAPPFTIENCLTWTARGSKQSAWPNPKRPFSQGRLLSVGRSVIWVRVLFHHKSVDEPS